MVIKTKKQLLLDFADNTTGDISAQDSRNVIESAMTAAIGSISTVEGTLSRSLGTSFELYDFWNANSATSQGVTPDFSASKITIDRPKIYVIQFKITFTGQSGRGYAARITVDDVPSEVVAAVDLSNQSDFATLLGIGGIAATPPQEIKLEVSADQGGSNFEPSSAILGVYGIGEVE